MSNDPVDDFLPMYVSPLRSIPLVYTQPPSDVPVLTVENYVKWYTLFLVHPTGRVEQIPFPEESPVGSAYCDHVPNPLACQKLAADNGWVWDENSLDMIWGRWRREAELDPEYDPETGAVG